jgi:hypothetical protein
MSFRSWFSHPIAARRPTASPITRTKGAAVAAGAPVIGQDDATSRLGSLVSIDSVATFPGSTAAVSIVWAGTEKVFSMPHVLWHGLIVSACAGVILYLMDATDPQASVEPRRVVRITVAVVNTFVIFFAASGIFDMFRQ